MVEPSDPYSLYNFSFDVSILRTCRQLQQEGEDILYHNLKFTLSTDRLKFLETLGRSQRSRILHLSITNLDLTDTLVSEMPLCEWKYLMYFIGEHCNSLQTLELELDIAELSISDGVWEKFGTQSEFAQALLHIRGLSYFQVHLSAQNIYFPPDRCAVYNQVYPWLKLQLTSTGLNSEVFPIDSRSDLNTAFPFLKLPVPIQRRILQLAALPKSQVIHPCLNPAVDGTNALSLLLTCRSISLEAEKIIYEQAIFSACSTMYQRDFKEFLRKRTPRQRGLMKRFYCRHLDHWNDRTFDRRLRSQFPNLVDLEGGTRSEIDHPCFYTIKFT
jgi:hypothetical protein